MMNSLATRILKFEQLTLHELYEVLKLRASIFVVEQDCVYQDLDDQDQHSVHVLGYYEGTFSAYTRIIPPDENNIIHIGRVLVIEKFRANQLGRQIMEKSMAYCQDKYPGIAIELAAQCYLRDFYESLGFSAISGDYLMDGIPHLDMRWAP